MILRKLRVFLTLPCNKYPEIHVVTILLAYLNFMQIR